MTRWTTEELTKLSDNDLLGLYDNCVRLGSEEAQGILESILKLLVARDTPAAGDTGLKITSPVGKLLIRLVNSPVGVAGAIDATARGLPALAGIEPLLIDSLGVSYSRRMDASTQAGSVIGKMMNRLGHHRTGKKGPMPEGSIAATAEIYTLHP